MTRHLKVGDTHGHLEVLKIQRQYAQSSRTGKYKQRTLLTVLCHRCGSERMFEERYLFASRRTTCGCAPRPVVQKITRVVTAGSACRSYKAWRRMNRENSQKDVSLLWQITNNSGGFYQFFQDMGEQPLKHVLARKDPAQPFGKDNCFWTPIKKDYTKPQPIIGKKYGKLKLISAQDQNARVLCDCGTEKIVNLNSLLYGHQKSCGCQK